MVETLLSKVFQWKSPRRRKEKHPRTKEWQRTAPYSAPWRKLEETTCWCIFLPVQLRNLQTYVFVGELGCHKQKKQVERKATAKIDMYLWEC